MTQTAIIRAGIVINIIEAAPQDVAGLPEGDVAVAAGAGAAIGGTYSDGGFVRPADPPPPARRRFTPNEFLARLTEQERNDLVEFGTSGPLAAKVWYAQFIGARDISIDDPRTGDGLAFLAANGKLTAERRAALLQPV